MDTRTLSLSTSRTLIEAQSRRTALSIANTDNTVTVFIGEKAEPEPAGFPIYAGEKVDFIVGEDEPDRAFYIWAESGSGVECKLYMAYAGRLR